MIGKLTIEHYDNLPTLSIIEALLDNDKSCERRLQHLNDDILSFIILKSSNPVINYWIGKITYYHIFNLHQTERLQILKNYPSRVEYLNNVLQCTSKNKERYGTTVQLIKKYIIERFNQHQQRFDSSLIKYLQGLRDATIDMLGAKSRLLNVVDSMMEEQSKKPENPLYTDFNGITCPNSQVKNCKSYRVCPETFQDYC